MQPVMTPVRATLYELVETKRRKGIMAKSKEMEIHSRNDYQPLSLIRIQ